LFVHTSPHSDVSGNGQMFFISSRSGDQSSNTPLPEEAAILFVYKSLACSLASPCLQLKAQRHQAWRQGCYGFSHFFE